LRQCPQKPFGQGEMLSKEVRNKIKAEIKKCEVEK
jgi:hypothetical protein